jgi:hypothetical protein
MPIAELEHSRCTMVRHLKNMRCDPHVPMPLAGSARGRAKHVCGVRAGGAASRGSSHGDIRETLRKPRPATLSQYMKEGFRPNLETVE